MIKKIAHTADWHLHHKDNHKKFEESQDLLASSLEQQFKGLTYHERLIIITGDLFDFKDKITQSNEAFSLMSKALYRLSEIGRVVITIGNHDYSINNKSKLDCISPIIENFEMLGNKNVTYLKHSKCLAFENIVFCNFSNFDGNKRPPIEQFRKLYPNHTFIGLFHDVIRDAKNFQGYDLTDDTCLTTKHFEGCDCVMMGDIHKHQEIEMAVYAGSLHQLDFGETVSGHGYCLWDIDDLSYDFIEIPMEYGKYKLHIKSFDDIDNDKEIFTNL
jgi:DNA repair exonuclease SbcCD nuclease subunit